MFEVRVREWERLVDQDGPEPENERTHRRRNTKLTQDPIDLSWELIGRFAAGQGAAMAEILDHYIEAELLADWEKARADKGDNATAADLPRTTQQRRADALFQLFQDAAAAEHGAVPPGWCHDVVWSPDTFEEMARRFAGADPQPLDPDTHRCETIDGIQLEPTEAFANALIHSIRRVIINAAGVTIDMGRKRRFEGALRDAINIQTQPATCVWPGCWVPASKCEGGHLHDHARGGLTNPRSASSPPRANRAPASDGHPNAGNTTDGTRNEFARELGK